MRVVNISEAKSSLSKLVERVLKGDEIIIGRAGKPVARLVPYEIDTTPRDLSQGIWEDEVWIADDFDELPSELLRAFHGEGDDESPA